MKLQTISLALCALLLASPRANAGIIQTDPVLSAAITAQTVALKSAYDERTKKHKSIIAAETAVTVAMNQIHKVENQLLDYLSNAQGAVQNLYQIKRAVELATIEIPQNIKFVGKSIPNNLKGTAIAAIVSDEMKDAIAESASLYPLMSQLVTSGSYNVANGDGTTSKKKVNLLDAAERFYIANEVVRRLESINTDLFLLGWQIRTYSLTDLFFHLAPESWCNYMAGKNLVETILLDYQYL